MSPYHTVFSSPAALSDTLRQAMMQLYFAHYEGSPKACFFADLAEKTEVLQVYYKQHLIGFSTFQIYEYSQQTEPIRIVYSGDTIVDRAHWGQQTLALSWIKRMGQLKREQPTKPLYWFLIVKGHRTYRYLPTFSKSFHPHWAVLQPQLKALADTLATHKFGHDYDANTGVVAFPQSRGHLKADFAQPSAQELKLKAVRNYLPPSCQHNRTTRKQIA